MKSHQIEERLKPLLKELFDNGLNQPQRDELTQLLSDSPEARVLYRKMLSVHTALEWTFAPQSLPLPQSHSVEQDPAERHHSHLDSCHLADLGQAAGPVKHPAPTEPPSAEEQVQSTATVFASVARLAESIHWRKHPGRFFVVASALTLLFWLGFYQWIAPDSSQTASHSVNDNTVAKVVASLTATQNCVWANDAEKPAEPMHLVEGQRLEVQSGLLEITYLSGARLILEGPATFILAAENAGQLDVGKLVATVPEKATGFAVETPTVTVSDLGTRFGVDVDSNGTTEIHVFEGLVEVQVPSNTAEPQQFLLNADEALRVVNSLVAPQRFASSLDGFSHGIVPPSTQSVPEHPEQIAVENFNYPPGRRVLHTFNGGYGWLGPWQGANDVLEPGLSYQRETEILHSAGGCLQTGSNLPASYRSINVTRVVPPALLSSKTENKIGAEGQEVWLSVIGQRTNQEGRWGGLSLFDGPREVFFIGDRAFGEDTWALEAKPGGDVHSRISTTECALLVVRIEFGKGAAESNERASLYVNPPLDDRSLRSVTPDAVLDDVGDFVFDRIRLASDIPAMSWDELRIGLTAESVLPPPIEQADKR